MTWDFIGIRRDDDKRYPGVTGFTWWRIPFIGRGAIGDHGCGHWRVLGIRYSWHDNSRMGWANIRELWLWGLLSIRYEGGNDLPALKPGFSFKRAKLRSPIERVM